jgi:hypothetical protein
MKIKWNGLDRVNDLVDNLLSDKTVFNKEFLKTQAEFIVERIKAFTRSGKTLAKSKKPERLKRLSSSYIAVREGAVKFRTINGKKVPFPEPDERLQDVDPEFFEPRLSNLTFTGQLLRSITSSVKNGAISIFVTGTRRDGLTNEKVAGYVSEQGRPFIGLDERGIKRIKRNAITEIRKFIRSRKR